MSSDKSKFTATAQDHTVSIPKLRVGTESFLAFKDGLIKRFFPNPHLKALFETGTIPKFDENVDQLS